MPQPRPRPPPWTPILVAVSAPSFMEALAPRPALCSRSLCHPLRSRIPPQDSIPVPPAIWSVIGGWRTARVWRTVLRDSVACCGLGGLWMARFWLPSERCGLNGGLQASSQDIRGFRSLFRAYIKSLC
ncbi:hypothetical protein NN561_017449 [Cricetulus griseus]